MYKSDVEGPKASGPKGGHLLTPGALLQTLCGGKPRIANGGACCHEQFLVLGKDSKPRANEYPQVSVAVEFVHLIF